MPVHQACLDAVSPSGFNKRRSPSESPGLAPIDIREEELGELPSRQRSTPVPCGIPADYERTGSYFTSRPLPPLTPPGDDVSSLQNKALPSLGQEKGDFAPPWLALNTSQPYSGQPLSAVLPTPPSAGGETFRPLWHSSTADSNVATVAVQPMGMGTALDALSAPGSLSNRRTAASGLAGQFELPPPPISQYNNSYPQHRFPSLSTVHAAPQTQPSASLSNILTPSQNHSAESLASPVSSGLNSSSTPTNGGMPSFAPSFFGNGQSPSGYGSTSYPQQPWPGTSSFLNGGRGMFSPSLGSMVRNSTNSPSSGYMPPPPDEINSSHLPPFQTSSSMSAPSSMPTSAADHRSVTGGMMGAQPSTTGPSQSPASATHESFSHKASPNPLYGGSQPSSTPQNGQFPGPFPGPSPVQQSPHSMSAPASRISPPVSHSPVGQQGHFVRYPHPSYSLPGMPGPIMTNVHSPGNQMSMIGNMQQGMMPGYNSGYAASAQHMYGGPGQNHPGPGTSTDRPFKCDQCVQSFNRNHDLKRHKRIHLAVKPYPCDWCDKSFSRKDALKVGLSLLTFSPSTNDKQRHHLVKGCGNKKNQSAESSRADEVAKSEPEDSKSTL
ncbi:MAG: hypothetical protein Q9227_008366 [Pyrenula ochraceoflavens]